MHGQSVALQKFPFIIITIKKRRRRRKGAGVHVTHDSVCGTLKRFGGNFGTFSRVIWFANVNFSTVFTCSDRHLKSVNRDRGQDVSRQYHLHPRYCRFIAVPTANILRHSKAMEILQQQLPEIYYTFCVVFILFYNSIVPLGFLSWELRVAFPG